VRRILVWRSVLAALCLLRFTVARAQDPNPYAGVTEEELSNQIPLGEVQVLGRTMHTTRRGGVRPDRRSRA
jgi:hypothetical protein